MAPGPIDHDLSNSEFVEAVLSDEVLSDAVLSDAELMGLALEEARAAGAIGEVPIGAVVVIDGKVVASRHNQREQLQDPTAHAELLAIRDAAAAIGSWRLENATVVVTLEPCAMCAGTMVNARIGRVVFGARSLENGACGSLYQLGSDPRLNHEFAVTADVRGEECSSLLSDYFAGLR
jgi:tRNA(Arg) A34 adenosine deaminase TadA